MTLFGCVKLVSARAAAASSLVVRLQPQMGKGVILIKQPLERLSWLNYKDQKVHASVDQ